MPSEPTAEQAEVRRKGRQRLVGAVVLALLAVVFVPMVLDPEPRRDRPEPALAIPPKDAKVAAAPAAAVVASPKGPEIPPVADAKPAEASKDPPKDPPKEPAPTFWISAPG